MSMQGQVIESLGTVLVLGVMRNLAKMNLVRDVSIDEGKVDVALASAALASEVQEWRKDKIKDTSSGLTGGC